jgi:hypothetical protein
LRFGRASFEFIRRRTRLTVPTPAASNPRYLGPAGPHFGLAAVTTSQERQPVSFPGLTAGRPAPPHATRLELRSYVIPAPHTAHAAQHLPNLPAVEGPRRHGEAALAMAPEPGNRPPGRSRSVRTVDWQGWRRAVREQHNGRSSHCWACLTGVHRAKSLSSRPPESK